MVYFGVILFGSFGSAQRGGLGKINGEPEYIIWYGFDPREMLRWYGLVPREMLV